MPEMIVKAPDNTREILEYEFTFNSGMLLPVQIDNAAGDFIKEDPDSDRIHVFLAAKPSMSDPDVMLGEESVTVFKTNLASIHKRVRIQRMPTPEELFNMQKFLHSQPKTVQ